jgi:hypothetical protein
MKPVVIEMTGEEDTVVPALWASRTHEMLRAGWTEQGPSEQHQSMFVPARATSDLMSSFEWCVFSRTSLCTCFIEKGPEHARPVCVHGYRQNKHPCKSVQFSLKTLANQSTLVKVRDEQNIDRGLDTVIIITLYKCLLSQTLLRISWKIIPHSGRNNVICFLAEVHVTESPR